MDSVAPQQRPPSRIAQLQLPPLPDDIKHLVNPYLDPQWRSDVHRRPPRTPLSVIAATTERLSKPAMSKALELHDQNVREVTGERRPSSRPVSRSSGRHNSPPPTLEAMVERYYSAPRTAQAQLKMTLERKHVLPIGRPHSSSGALMTPSQVAEFIERNVSRPQSRAESRQSNHRASIAALQKSSRLRQDHAHHFYTEQVQASKGEKERVMSLYAQPQVSRPLSPADQKRSADRLSSAGPKS